MIKAYLICPVRNVTEDQKQLIDKVIETYSTKYELHSFKNVNQDDPTGYYIIDSHQQAIKNADIVLVFWDSNSLGSIFDLGMAVALEKPLQFVGGKPSEKDLNGKSHYKVAKIIEKFGYHRSITQDYQNWEEM